jgi:DNA-directed RNA polymerase alpha subunit
MKSLREYVDVFIEQMDNEPVLTPLSSIRRIPSLPSITLNGLLKVGILTVGDLMECKPEYLLRIPVIGRIGLQKIQEALASIETDNRH